jgi:hypothetical protein
VPIVVKAREIGVIVTVARTWSSLYSRADQLPYSEPAQALPGLHRGRAVTAAPVSTHRTGRDPRELASRTVKPRLSAYRKLSKHGNSLMIAPPREFLTRPRAAEG